MATETYTLRDAAATMGVSTRQVHRYISQGKLKRRGGSGCSGDKSDGGA